MARLMLWYFNAAFYETISTHPPSLCLKYHLRKDVFSFGAQLNNTHFECSLLCTI